MKLHKTQNILRRIPSGACLAVSGALLVAGSIGMTYSLTRASASEYSLTGGSVTLDGTSDGSVAVALKTSVARTYVAMDGKWSLHEVVGTGETQTSYLSLSGMTRGGTITTEYGSTNGVVSWFSASDAQNLAVAANGPVLTATYKVDKNTPAGTYKVSFSEGAFTYSVNGSDVNENDAIATDATVTVTRGDTGDDSGSTGGSGNNNENSDGGDSTSGTTEQASGDATESNTASDESTTSGSTSSGSARNGLIAPDTGAVTRSDDGADAMGVSVAAMIAAVVLFAATVRMKGHKKIDFGKE